MQKPFLLTSNWFLPGETSAFLVKGEENTSSFQSQEIQLKDSV